MIFKTFFNLSIILRRTRFIQVFLLKHLIVFGRHLIKKSELRFFQLFLNVSSLSIFIDRLVIEQGVAVIGIDLDKLVDMSQIFFTSFLFFLNSIMLIFMIHCFLIIKILTAIILDIVPMQVICFLGVFFRRGFIALFILFIDELDLSFIRFGVLNLIFLTF